MDNAFEEAQDTRPHREIDYRDRISVGWTVARICVLFALLLVVNVLPEGLGISLTRSESGHWILRPALDASLLWPPSHPASARVPTYSL